MPYECENCGTAWVAGTETCSKCGQSFKPKAKRITPGVIIFAVLCWPVGLIGLMVLIWQHPTWQIKTKALLVGLIVATVAVTAETINIKEGNNQAPSKSATAIPVASQTPAIGGRLEDQKVTMPALPAKHLRKEASISEFYNAIHNNNADKVNRMLRSNPELMSALSSQQAGFGNNPLIEALNNDDDDVLKALLAHGADINAKSSLQSGRQTALHFASHDGHLSTVELLIGRGADVNALTPQKQTPLYLVSMDPEPNNSKMKAEQCKIAELLIQKGADVNAKDNVGQTPLHLAADGARLDIAKILLKNGADINAENMTGVTPLTEMNGIGAEAGNDTMQTYLRSRGARESP